MDNIIIKLVVEKPDVVVDLKIDRPDVKYSELVTNMFKGERGERGEQGLQGERGEQGIQGVKGDKGEQGIQGIQGETGNGIESIIKSSTNGLVDTYTILYTNGNTQSFNVTNGANGKHGADGKDGIDGKNATIVGLSVNVDNTTGTPSATATMGGTPNERTFDFSFSGIKGERGSQGESGVYIGETPPNDPDIKVWIDETSSSDVIDTISSLEKTLEEILKIIQGGELDDNTVSKIEELIVSYFENKNVEEIEA